MYLEYLRYSRKDIKNHDTFKDFAQANPIFKKFADYEGYSWVERHFDAAKVRETIVPDFFYSKTLQMPKALLASDFFERAEVTWEKEANKTDTYFCSTIYAPEIDAITGWQDGKFMHLRVKPTMQVTRAVKEHMGYPISSFRIFKVAHVGYVISAIVDAGAMTFESFLGVVHDLSDLLTLGEKQ